MRTRSFLLLSAATLALAMNALHCGTVGLSQFPDDCSDGATCSRGDDGKVAPFAGDFAAPTSLDGGEAEGAVCADIDVRLGRVVPKVLFLLDQSSSMYWNRFPSGDSNDCNPDCRWSVLKDVLIGPPASPGGLVAELSGEADLGIELYSATDPNPNDGDNSELPPPTDAVCPRFKGRSFDGVTVTPSAAAQIEAELRPATVDDDTPTGPAVRTVVGLLDDGGVDPRGLAALPASTPRVLVLVTDGEPTLCGQNYPSDPAKALVVKSVADTFATGIPTFVVALGDTTAQAEAHFKAVANAGQGKDPTTGEAQAIRPTTKSSLVAALRKIVLDTRTCRFTLNGAVKPGLEGTGRVELNGASVPYAPEANPAAGWRLVSPSELELVGATCDALKASGDAALSAKFACDAVMPR